VKVAIVPGQTVVPEGCVWIGWAVVVVYARNNTESSTIVFGKFLFAKLDVNNSIFSLRIFEFYECAGQPLLHRSYNNSVYIKY
jgi:hypothetical protein